MESNGLQYYIFKGRITRVEKYQKREPAFINGKYYEYGEYCGTRLEIEYSLYDTDKQFLSIAGKNYLMPVHITLNIYDDVMELLKKQRMSEEVKEYFERWEGTKQPLYVVPVENSVVEQKGSADVDLFFLLPTMIGDKQVKCRRTVRLTEVMV